MKQLSGRRTRSEKRGERRRVLPEPSVDIACFLVGNYSASIAYSFRGLFFKKKVAVLCRSEEWAIG